MCGKKADDNFVRALQEEKLRAAGKLNSRQKKAIIVWTIITCVIWIGWAVARFTVGGSCERPALQKEFERGKYLRRWYEMYRENTVPFESEDCATATYVEQPGNYIQVNNIEYAIEK